MSTGDDVPKITHKSRKIGTIGISFIVMGISLLIVYLLWLSFGHIGPSFSADVLSKQQASLRSLYGLPHVPTVTDPKVLQTPPSLRPFLNNNTAHNLKNKT